MNEQFPGLVAEHAQVGAGVAIGARSRILCRQVILGEGVVIGDDVTIVADRFEAGAGSRIASACRILCPEIRLGAGASIGSEFNAELDEQFSVGRRTDIGRHVRIVGRSMVAGDHFWMTDGVTIGGGGARGPRARLTIGDRSAVMDRCYINISEPVVIGDDTALSVGVTILTHSLWQPVLTGGTTVFAATRIGSRNILYVNATIAPGVTTGDDVTVAANALVLQDVPSGATAVGNPARIVKSTPASPRALEPARRDALIREMLRDYAETLPMKGVTVQDGQDPDVIEVVIAGTPQVIRHLPDGGDSARADITLAFGAADGRRGVTHFDLDRCAMIGESTPLAEDLRDHLRRRTIRIFTDLPFRSLPAANLARLRARLQEHTP